MRDRPPLEPCMVTVSLEDPWVALLEIEAQDGAPVIASVVIERRNGPHSSTAPSEAQLPLPKGGLLLRTLRSLAFGEALIAARGELGKVTEDTLAWHGFSPETLEEPRRPGKRGHSERYYAEIAAAYVAAVERGSQRPVADVAEAMGELAPFVRDKLHLARRRGLLSPSPGRGVGGGTLTAKARATLAL